MAIKDTLTNLGKALKNLLSGSWIPHVLRENPRNAAGGDGNGDSGSPWNDLSRVVLALYVGLIFGVIAIFWREGFQAGAALAWALASFMTGALVGFLFGIPRVLQT